MDQLSEMRVFVRAIERGSFALAAQDFGMSPSAVSKLVSRLEARLGVRLMVRTTRRHALTAEGELYFESGRRLVASFDELETEVAAAAGRPRGLLRVNTTLAFGANFLALTLSEFRARYPEVQLDLGTTDRHVDLVAEQVDVAIRNGELRDSRLMARRIGETRRLICASPDYLARRGLPRTPGELDDHELIGLRSIAGAPDRWLFRDADGKPAVREVAGPLATDSAFALLAMARQGAGIIRVGETLVSASVTRGDLQPIEIEGHDPEPWPLAALFPAGTQRVSRVRVFLDFLIERFGDSPWRIG